MARTKGSIGWKTKQKYLHDKFPDQGWMDETDKKVINEHYASLKTKEVVEKRDNPELAAYAREVVDNLAQQAQEMKMETT